MTEGRSVEESRVETVRMVRPNHLNAAGRLFGGILMQWLDEKNGSTALTTKSIQKAISGQRAVGDPFNDYFCSMFDKVGADAETTMILVDAWNEETETPGTYKAKKYNVVVDCTNDGGGAVADGLLIEGIIYVNGDPVEGTFVEATKTFTEGMAE